MSKRTLDGAGLFLVLGFLSTNYHRDFSVSQIRCHCEPAEVCRGNQWSRVMKQLEKHGFISILEVSDSGTIVLRYRVTDQGVLYYNNLTFNPEVD